MLLMALMVSHSSAQFEIIKYSINNGGSKQVGGPYELKTSIGQADASGKLSGGNYSLNAGNWHQNNNLIYKNGFE